MKPQKINEQVRPQAGLLIAVITVCGIIALFVIYVRGAFWGQEFPRNSFLPAPVTRFGDLFGNHDHWRRLHFDDISYAGAYFPATYLFLHFVVNYIGEAYHALFLYFFTLVTGVLVSLRLIFRSTATSGVNSFLVLLITVVNYPILFMIHTGNLEGWILVLLLFAVANVIQHKNTRAAIFLGVAVAMKLYPAVFLVVLFHKKTSRESIKLFLVTSVSALGTTLFSLMVLPGGFTSGIGVIRNMFRSQDLYRELMIDGPSGINFGHSLLNGIHAAFGLETLRTADWWLLLAGVGFLVLLGVFLLQNCSDAALWRQATLAACIGCLFVPTSTDYKLVYFIPGIVLYCCSNLKLTRIDVTVGVLVGVIVSPKPWLILPKSDYYNAGVWLTPILMSIVLVVLLIDALRSIQTEANLK
jgi:hypothetical protein